VPLPPPGAVGAAPELLVLGTLPCTGLTGEVEAGELGAGEVGAGSLAIVPSSAQAARPKSRPAAGISSDSFFIISILAFVLALPVSR
jgi:hypothetical protein